MFTIRRLITAVVVLALIAGLTIWIAKPFDWKEPYAAEPAEPVEWEDESESFWEPPQQVTVEEFRQKYARYFEPEYLAKQSERMSKDLNVDTLHSCTLRIEDEVLGTLFIDNHGNVVRAVKHPRVDHFFEGLAAVATADDPIGYGWKNYGYIDRTGQFAIPAEYDSAASFVEGLAAVEKAGLWGFINRHGEVVIPLRYKRVESFSEGIASVWPDSETVHLIDTSGRPLFQSTQSRPGRFREGLCPVNSRDYPEVEVPQEQGYINRDMQFVIRVGKTKAENWTQCYDFHEGLAAVQIGRQQQGFINHEGEFVIPATFNSVSSFSDERAMATFDHGIFSRSGFIDRTGKLVIGPKFLEVGLFHEGLAPVCVPIEEDLDDLPRASSSESGRWGYVDRSGKMVIPPQFYEASNFKNGLARVRNNPIHEGFINKNGEFVWQVAYPSEAYYAKRESIAASRKKREQAANLAHVGLHLHVETPVVKLGEFPLFSAELINNGAKAIVIVLPDLESTYGMKTPIVRWKPRMKMGSGCMGFSGRVKSKEIITLQPGESVNVISPDDLPHGPSLHKVGKHKVTLEIENVPGLIWDDSNSDPESRAVMERVRRSSPFKATSETVEIEVVE